MPKESFNGLVACYIVKNEHDWIEDSILQFETDYRNPLCPFGVVVLDTGSSSKATMSLAKYACKGLPHTISSIPWTNFADARNKSLAAAKELVKLPSAIREGLGGCNHVLIVDPDQRYSDENLRKLVESIRKNPDALAWTATVVEAESLTTTVEETLDGAEALVSRWPQFVAVNISPELAPPNGEYFNVEEGALHESLTRWIAGRKVVDSGAKLVHYGLARRAANKKNYVETLEEELANDITNMHVRSLLLMELYTEAGTALSKLVSSMEAFVALLGTNPKLDKTDFIRAITVMAQTQAMQGNFTEARRLVARATEQVGSCGDLSYLGAMVEALENNLLLARYKSNEAQGGRLEAGADGRQLFAKAEKIF